MAYHVRILTEQDIDLYPDRFKATEWTIEAMAEKDARDLIASPHDDILMALDERDTFAGMIHCRIQKNGHEAHLQQVFVAPDFRGRGAADFLMDSAQGWAAERGLTLASLMVAKDNPRALHVYRRNGYHPVTTNFNSVASLSGSAMRPVLVTPADWPAYNAFQEHYAKDGQPAGIVTARMLVDQTAFVFFGGQSECGFIFKGGHEGGHESFAQINLRRRGDMPDSLVIDALFLSPQAKAEHHAAFLAGLRHELALRFGENFPIYADLDGEDPETGAVLKSAGFKAGGYFMVKNLEQGVRPKPGLNLLLK